MINTHSFTGNSRGSIQPDIEYVIITTAQGAFVFRQLR